MLKIRIFTIAAISLLSCYSMKCEALPDGNAIMHSMVGFYLNAKTVQQKWKAKTTLLPGISMGADVKLDLKGQKVYMEITPILPSIVPQLSMVSMLAQSDVYMNNKGINLYFPTANTYSTIKIPPTQSPQNLEMLLIQQISSAVNSPGVTFKVVGTSVVNTIICWEIEEEAPKTSQEHTTFYIDQNSDHLIRIAMTYPSPVGGTISTNLTIKKEMLNAPLPNSIFQFTPPPGATKLDIPNGPSADTQKSEQKVQKV